MDFDKIKPAVEEITLSEIQKERILEECRKKKRKKFNYKLWVPIAAAAMFAVVLFSPGFLFRAKNSDSLSAEIALQDTADEEKGNAFDGFYLNGGSGTDVSVQENFSIAETDSLFRHEGFRRIYSAVPAYFSYLVDAEEFESWKSTVSSENGMAMAQFVEHFGISREDFDIANAAYAALIDSLYGGHLEGKPSSPEEENAEIFNADIIYTFDKEKIDEYYSADYE